MLGERLYVNVFTTELSEQPLEEPTWTSLAVVQVKTSGASENYCPSAAYRRRGTPNKVGPTQCAEPLPFESTTDVNQPIDVSIEDLISLHPGDEEQLGSPDETHGGDIQASQDLSDISTVDFDELGESDSEDMLHKLAEAYDNAFPVKSSATPASNSSSDTSTSFSPDDLSSSETSGCSTSNGTDASQPQVLVQGINLSLVRTTRTYPDGKIEEQRVASVGYTNSVNPGDIIPQELFSYIQREFVEYMNGNYYMH